MTTFASVSARQNSLCRAECNKAPFMYEMKGALSSPPPQVGRLPGLADAARRPPGPDARAMYRLPGPFYVSEVGLRWCPFPAVKAFLLPP